MVYPALLSLMRTPRLPVVDWTDSPAGLNGLARFVERRKLVPSHLNWPLQTTRFLKKLLPSAFCFFPFLLRHRPIFHRQAAYRTVRTRHVVCYTNTADRNVRHCWRPHVGVTVEQRFVLRTRRGRQLNHREATCNLTIWLDGSNQTSITLLIVWWSCKRRCVSFDWTVTICTEQLK